MASNKKTLSEPCTYAYQYSVNTRAGAPLANGTLDAVSQGKALRILIESYGATVADPRTLLGRLDCGGMIAILEANSSDEDIELRVWEVE